MVQANPRIDRATRGNDIKDFPTSENASSCSYTPYDNGGVINAAAYRAFLLTSASQFFSNDDYWKIAERNLNFVLENQNPDGSWFTPWMECVILLIIITPVLS